MIKYIVRIFTRIIYSLLTYKTIILDNDSTDYYTKLDHFSEVEVSTTSGTFIFQFKQDRRKNKRGKTSYPNISNYIIQLKIPDDLKYTNEYRTDVIVIVICVALFKPDYEILVEVLSDKYLNSILNRIEKSSF